LGNTTEHKPAQKTAQGCRKIDFFAKPDKLNIKIYAIFTMHLKIEKRINFICHASVNRQIWQFFGANANGLGIQHQ